MGSVLSLFDGMSCGRVALGRAGISVDRYYASEIDRPAIQVSGNNYPDIIQIGDVNNWRDWDIDWDSIDLLLGGSPCQGFSFAGKQLAFDDPHSRLFFVYVDILNHIRSLNPNVKFLLENVRMKPADRNTITKYLGCDPICINSALVSAQNRVRYYWANWPICAPQEKGIVLSSILQDLGDCPIGQRVREKSKCIRVGGRNSPFGDRHEWDAPFQRISKKAVLKSSLVKSGCLTGGAHSDGNHSDMDIIHTETATRRYSVTECERLQTLPDGYTEGVSNSQRYKMLGNGWTVDVVAHILSRLPNERKDQ